MRGFVLWGVFCLIGGWGKGGELLLNFHQMLAMRHGTVEGEAQSFSLKLNFLEVFFKGMDQPLIICKCGTPLIS